LTKNNENVTYNDITSAWTQLFAKTDNDGGRAMNALGLAYTNNPYVQSQRVKSINSLPMFFKRSELENFTKNMSENEQPLRETGWALFSVYPLLKLYYMYADILTYRYYITPKYVGKAEVSRKDFWEEHKYVHKLVDEITPKRTFRNIALDTVIEGKTAYCLRLGLNENDYNKNTKLPKVEYCDFQKIPSDYWKITGVNSESKFTVSVNFALFWKPGVSITQYPPIFKRYYDLFTGLVDTNGKLKADVNKLRENDILVEYHNSTYYYWVTMPLDEVFVFSHCESHSWQLPNFAGLFLQAQDLQSYSYLQEELLQLPLSSVIIGTLPMNNPKSIGGSANNFSLSPEAVGFFENLFNSVAPRGVKFMLAPGQGYQHFKFDNSVPNNINIVTETQQQWISSSGTGGLISTTNKPSQAMVKSSQKIEPRYVDRFYEQWMNAVDIIFEKKIGTKYTWKFNMEGDIFNDEDVYNKCDKAISIGQNDVMPQYKSFFNEDMEDVMSRQHYINASKIYDRMQLVESAFNSKNTGQEAKNGRPKADENNIESDGTANAIDGGSNTSDGRVVDFIKSLSFEEMEDLKDICFELIEEEEGE